MTCLRLTFFKSMILMMNEWQDWHAAENDNFFLLKLCFYINMKIIFVVSVLHQERCRRNTEFSVALSSQKSTITALLPLQTLLSFITFL